MLCSHYIALRSDGNRLQDDAKLWVKFYFLSRRANADADNARCKKSISTGWHMIFQLALNLCPYWIVGCMYNPHYHD